MMKKVISVLMVAVMIFSLAACGQKAVNNGGENKSGTSTDKTTEKTTVGEDGLKTDELPDVQGKTLVVYFSWSTSGNTEKMAQYIQEQVNGELLEIEPLNPYPDDYDKCVDIALAERDNNERPKIANLPDSIKQYDTIFIGYPIWWHTAPMIIGTFLESYDLSGVQVYPFTQSASMDTEQFENSMEFVRKSARGADVHDGLFVTASDTEGIREYLIENGLVKSDSIQSDSNESNILITYFTVPETDGVDTVANASRVAADGVVLGNTEFIAMEIQKNLGGDLFAIETVQDYPGTHSPLLDFAYDEKSKNARPVLSSHIENLDGYDIVFVGFPNWNADLPMPLYTFFEEYDFSGKMLIPFVTHGGSGFSSTINTIQNLEPNATVVKEGLSISRNSVANAQADVKKWTDALIVD